MQPLTNGRTIPATGRIIRQGVVNAAPYAALSREPVGRGLAPAAMPHHGRRAGIGPPYKVCRKDPQGRVSPPAFFLP